MTISIAVKVNDGIVLAADSASTHWSPGAAGQPVVSNVYYNADKVFNLFKGLPIGATTWGSGSIGEASISTLVKTFRSLISSPGSEWSVNPNDYNVSEVATKLRKFIYEQHYRTAFKEWPSPPYLGFLVGGYSTQPEGGEILVIEISEGECSEPKVRMDKKASGVQAFGEPNAIDRLVTGFDLLLLESLHEDFKVPRERMAEAVQRIRARTEVYIVPPAMPIQDTIDLARFLAETTVGFSRFRQGAQTVGGPIDIAAITQHEDFKWVQRKHYYTSVPNPPTARSSNDTTSH